MEPNPAPFGPAPFGPAQFEVATATGTSRLPARGSVIRVGRAGDNDLVLSTEPTVSRRHAELHFDGACWSVRDLESHNGTFVNGEPLSDGETRRIGATDVVAFGNVTLRLVADAATDAMTVEDAGAVNLHKLLSALSMREQEVLALVAAGRTDDQVATELYISVKTVHSHLDRIRDKTGLRRRAELTRLAVRLGMRGDAASP